MKILLIGNYEYSRSQSMDRFASLLYDGLKARGHAVRLLKPPGIIGRLRRTQEGVGKWLGYLDRFVLFRPSLKKSVSWADVVHICDQANAVYVPMLKDRPHVVTCHDVLAIRSALGQFSEHRTQLTGRLYQRWILSGLKKTQSIACDSEATRDDVLSLTGLAAEKTSVVPIALNYSYQPMVQGELSRHLEEMGLAECRQYLLHVGDNSWYKNKSGLLRIFAKITEAHGSAAGNLVLAGSALPKKLTQMAKDLGIQDRVKEATNVTNEQLCALYSGAQGLVFPSLAEGFGWPIIEAQACGCPVFTSNRRPMTEVGGNGAEYFDPENIAGAAKTICRALENRGLLIDSGFRNAARYSAEAMISDYENIYRSAVR